MWGSDVAQWMIALNKILISSAGAPNRDLKLKAWKIWKHKSQVDQKYWVVWAVLLMDTKSVGVLFIFILPHDMLYLVYVLIYIMYVLTVFTKR